MTILSSPPPVTDLLALAPPRPSPAAYLHGAVHRLGRLMLMLAGVVVQ